MKTIVVVDNSKVILKYMKKKLSEEGYEVLTAENGLSALDILKTTIPDVMFIDLVMPNIRGEKLCRIIRSMPALKDTYLVILSAIAAEEEIDFLKFGADACIVGYKEIRRHSRCDVVRRITAVGIGVIVYARCGCPSSHKECSEVHPLGDSRIGERRYYR